VNYVLAVKVVMPQFYETMQAGKIAGWLKKEGDRVEKGSPIVEVETDKATVEIEAPENGVLAKILAEEGIDVPVLQIIAVITMPEETLDLDSLMRQTASGVSPTIEEVEKPIAQGSGQLEKPAIRGPISPLARKLAREHGIDVTKIRGSGPGGRITREDVMEQTKERTAAAHLAPRLKHARLIPISKMRKAIAEQMSYSARTAPQVTLTTEVDVSEVVRLRERLLPDLDAAIGVRLSYTEILVKVVAMALRQQPICNSRLDGDMIRLIDEINVGVAVEVEEGLIVPVVHDADKKTLSEIAKSTKLLIDGAREGKLSASQLTGSTFTITNLGPYGVDAFTPLINPPETAILGVGRILEKPVVSNGEVKIRPMMYLSLSFDHRVIDGALAARFLQTIRQALEDPSSVLV
jgi:pyruvate dehydrogenase E2 component (dihydrolipoamide acetyltransferase)